MGKTGKAYFTWAGLSDIGRVRERNEDVWAALPQQHLFLIADGIGGHRAGEVAAQCAVESCQACIPPAEELATFALEEQTEVIRWAFAYANQQVHSQGQAHSRFRGMGTTLSLLCLCEKYALLAYVGDSRIYRLRQGSLQLLTEDHSVWNARRATGEGSLIAPSRRHVLTRAIGTQPTVEPSLFCIELQGKDRFLLCSDGLSNYVSDACIEQVLLDNSLAATAAEALVDSAYTGGGGDNITVLIVDIAHDLP